MHEKNATEPASHRVFIVCRLRTAAEQGSWTFCGDASERGVRWHRNDVRSRGRS